MVQDGIEGRDKPTDVDILCSDIIFVHAVSIRISRTGVFVPMIWKYESYGDGKYSFGTQHHPVRCTLRGAFQLGTSNIMGRCDKVLDRPY